MFCLFSQKKLPLIAAVAFFYWMISIPVVGAAVPENPEEISWHISALMVTYDKERELYIAEDDVVITGGVTRLEADYVEFSNKTKEAFAQGNVLLLSGQDSITCNAMQINLLTEKGTINKGTIFVQENNLYISGENIKKTGKFTYSADKGSITSCEGENPDWKITGKDIKVTVEGYGSARNAVLWAKKIPSLYAPYLSFPVQTKRQTGFLIPRITSSDRKGFEYEQPLYIAISKNVDATLYADYMADRGVKVAGELRYVMDNTSRGALFFDFLDDLKTDDGTDSTKDYRYDTTPQRTNQDRYWFRMKHDQDLTHGFTGKLDIDIVSDADYLLEFKDGSTGFDDTNQYFEDTFGRGLDEYDDTTRTNSLNINRYGTNYNFNVQALWYDDVIARRTNATDTTLQTLPGIEFDTSKQQIGNSGIFYTLDSEFRSFYRQDTTDTLVNGQRADLYPKFYLPVRFGRAFFFEPFLGTRGTAWHTDDFTDVHGETDGFRTRATYDVGAQLSTTVNQVFTLDNGFADKLKHTIVPKLAYLYQPNEIQDDLPYFDTIDSIERSNRVTWSLTNSLIARNHGSNPDGTQINQYKEFVWVKLYQSYDLEPEIQDNQSNAWSDISLESEFNFLQYFSMYADVDWSPYANQITQTKVGVNLSDHRGDSISTSYQYSEDTFETWYTRLNIRLTDSVMAYYSFENNLKTNDNVESIVGITVTKACWGLGLQFKDTSSDKSITFLISLNGIGGFGTQ
jgi:LPS-assembly protein